MVALCPYSSGLARAQAIDWQPSSPTAIKQLQEIQIMVGKLDRSGEQQSGAEGHLHNVELVEGALSLSF
jgi:hypothetical protein